MFRSATSRSIAALLIALAPIRAAAQTAPPAAAAQTSSRVELEAYGSVGRMPGASESTVSLPAAGAPITTSSPLFPSRRVSSWMFGDGSTLLNDVNRQLGVTAQITPLDGAIALIGRVSQPTDSFGGRIRIRTAPRVWAELAVDVTGRPKGTPDDVVSAVLQTRSSFVDAMTGLLASGPFSGTTVGATASFAQARWRDVTTTLAGNLEFGQVAGLTPSLTIGGGFVMRTGQQPEITLNGHYQTKILGVVPIDETDRVTIRSVAGNAPVIVAGAGLSRTFADHLTFRVDGRMYATNRIIRTNIDASPLIVNGTPADFIESFTNPSVQFSNNTSTGRRSSLSGDVLDHVEAARSTHLQARMLLTFGLAIRF